MQTMKRKTLVLLTAIVLSIGILTAGTYAWFYDADQVPNEFQLANLGAHITEVFDPDLIIPGVSIEKDVQVANHKSNIPILVRVKLTDVFQMLVSDPLTDAPKIYWMNAPGEGTGEKMLKASPEFIATVKADWEEVTGQLTGVQNYVAGVKLYRREATDGTAKTKYTYFTYVEATGQLAQLSNRSDSTPIQLIDGVLNAATAKLGYGVNVWDNERSGDLKFNAQETVISGAQFGLLSGSSPYNNQYVANAILKIVFGDDVKFSGGVNEGQWFASDDGYFYYKGLLQPGAETPSLIKSVEFFDSMGNIFQGSKYILTPYLEALQPTADAMTSSAAGGWGLTETSFAYTQLAPFCN